MRQNNTSIFKSLPIIATMLCSRFGVKVSVGGSEAWTDGEAIRLPALLDAPVSERELMGFLVHECGHVRYSTFFKKGRMSELQFTILNILEDGRIERLMQNAFPGARFYFENLEKKLAEGAIPEAAGVRDLKAGDEPVRVLFETVYLWARIRMAGFPAQYGARWPAAERVLASTFGDVFAKKLRALLEEACEAKDTTALKGIAERILRLLRRLAKKTASERDAEGSKDCSAGESASPSSSSLPSPSSSSSSSHASAAASALEASDFNVNRAAASMLPHERTREALSAAGCDPDRSVGVNHPVDLREMIPGVAPDPLKVPVAALSESVAEVEREADSLVPLLQRSIRSAVEARDRVQRLPADRGGRITTSGLVRFVSGDPRICERKASSKAVRTAIHILLDFSGSMYLDDRQTGAKKAGIALLKVLGTQKGVSLGVSLFPEAGGKAVRPVLLQGRNAGRASLAHAVKLIAAARPMGGTPIREALLAASCALLHASKAMRATRRILYVLTDGAIRRSAADCLPALRAAGIETRALLINGAPCGFDVERVLESTAGPEAAASALIDMAKADIVRAPRDPGARRG